MLANTRTHAHTHTHTRTHSETVSVFAVPLYIQEIGQAAGAERIMCAQKSHRAVAMAQYSQKTAKRGNLYVEARSGATQTKQKNTQ